jgi:beta-lactam-binding protein with PASTA domain
MSEAKSLTATFSAPPASPPAPCIVPTLQGKSLKKARSALEAAHCALGRVTRPKARAGRKPGPLVVRSSNPGPGATLPAGAKVDLRLGKPRRRRG